MGFIMRYRKLAKLEFRSLLSVRLDKKKKVQSGAKGTNHLFSIAFSNLLAWFLLLDAKRIYFGWFGEENHYFAYGSPVDFFLIKDTKIMGAIAHHFFELCEISGGGTSVEVGVVISGWGALFHRVFLHDHLAKELTRTLAQIKFRMERMYQL